MSTGSVLPPAATPGDRSRSQGRGQEARKKPEDQGAEIDDQKINPKKAPLARLPAAILRATYQNTKQIRELEGFIITTVKISDADPLVEVIEQENRNYTRAIRREGESHGSGPPAPGAAMAMMEALTQQDIGAKSKGDFTATIERTTAMDQYHVQDIFPTCKLEKAYKSGQAKILFNCRDYEIRQSLMTALHNADKQACVGPAPAGFVEDEWTLWMDALVGEVGAEDMGTGKAVLAARGQDSRSPQKSDLQRAFSKKSVRSFLAPDPKDALSRVADS
ncbi:unnamed protein product, partial [Prorocentrum cordatum]